MDLNVKIIYLIKQNQFFLTIGINFFIFRILIYKFYGEWILHLLQYSVCGSPIQCGGFGLTHIARIIWGTNHWGRLGSDSHIGVQYKYAETVVFRVDILEVLF